MCRVLLLVYVMVVNALLSECAINNSKSNPCPTMILLRGRVKYRQKGKFAKFQCNTGYMLAGERYSSCVKGKWDEKLPVCVKPSCSKVKAPVNGLIYPQYNGAVLNFFCKAGYVLRGNQIAYCDGFRWSTNLPTCVLNGAEPAMACDFESEDMCGWTHDLNHDFDWRRYNFQTPSGHIGTGPRSDHTKGEGRDGYYVYIESSSRIENDSARFISPVYNKMENGICFTFYYHMYGAGMGTLKVYVKEESQTYSTKFLRPKFIESGNQGDVWKKGVVSLSKVNEPFQIIVEGIRGRSYVSDIAIDDVNLVSYECDDDEFLTLSTTEESTDIAPFVESCLNRCNNNSDTIYTDNFVLACDCVDSCIENNSCCPDYIAICVLDSSTDCTESYEISTTAIENDNFDKTTKDQDWPFTNDHTTDWEPVSTTKKEIETTTRKRVTTSTEPASTGLTERTTKQETVYTYDSETTTRSTDQYTATTEKQPNVTKSREFVLTTTPRPTMNNSKSNNASTTMKPVFTFNRTFITTVKPMKMPSSVKNDNNTKSKSAPIKPNIIIMTSTSTSKPVLNNSSQPNRPVTLGTTKKPRSTNATSKHNTTTKNNITPNFPKNTTIGKNTTKTNSKSKIEDGIVLNVSPKPKYVSTSKKTPVTKPETSKPVTVPTKHDLPKLTTSKLMSEASTTDRAATLEIETDYNDSVEVLLEGPTVEQVSKYAEIHSEPTTMSTHLIMGILCSIVFTMLVVLSAVFIARRYNVRLCNRFSFQNSRYSESMSDVRFLTNDEVLDFTWRTAHN